jgi:hypothetical protein
MTQDVRATIGIALMSAWIGAAILLAASVAPAAFAVLSSRTLAGELVGRVLPVVFIGGIAISIACLLLTTAPGWPRRIAAAVTIIACGIAQFFTGPRIARVRDEIGSAVDVLPLDHPQRVLFGRLHVTSVALLGAALLAALIFVVLSLRTLRARA